MIGSRLGNFEIIGVIGHGGMGVVYRARQVSLDRMVALKVVDAASADDDVAAERFRREAHAMAQLQHPNIVDVIEIGAQDGVHYFAMQYIEGQCLANLIEQKGELADAEAAEIAAQVADALQHAHERGVVHRDIKPANILIAQDGRPVVTDFGIAKAMEGLAFASGRSLTQGVVGTPEYMSPEIIRGNPVDGRTDLYSLGVVIHQMMTGRVPFTATTPFEVANQHLTARPDLPKTRSGSTHECLRTIALRALAKEPADRFASAAEMAAALRAGRPVPLPPPPAEPDDREAGTAQPTQQVVEPGTPAIRAVSGHDESRKTNGLRLALGLALVGVLLLGVSIVWTMRSENGPVRGGGGITASNGSAGSGLEPPAPDGQATGHETAAEESPPGEAPDETAIALMPEPEVVSTERDPAAKREQLKQRYWEWLNAWQSENLQAYLSFYADDCEIKRTGRSSYGKTTLRTRLAENFAQNLYISIDSADPTIEIHGDTATVSAWQQYDSSTWWDKGTKSLGWRYQHGEWHITWESFLMSSGGGK